jgi:formylglycine-generating enzyme required for sulfatase activity
MQYNSNEKRKFKKVKFRLPTDMEWITAAKGGNPAAIYPWEGGELRTSKGLYRCNFKRTVEDSIAVTGKLKDNADVTAPVQSYWPNESGIYNMSGNVAEMLAEKGQTKGGSWQDTAEAMKIGGDGKFASFENPMPTIGFRYCMDLLEK